MSDSRHFFMAFKPPTATKQELHMNTVTKKPYHDAAWESAESTIAAHLERHRPAQPITGPVILEVTWCFPATGGRAHGEPKTTKPDTDNLMKGLKDVMTRLGWWDDDAQVFDERTVKVWSDVPGIRIDIEEVVS